MNTRELAVIFPSIITVTCHNGNDGVSNHHPHDCLLNRSFRRRSKKTSKLRVTGLCAGNSPVSPPKWPVTRKMFPFDDVIMIANARIIHLSGVRVADPVYPVLSFSQFSSIIKRQVSVWILHSYLTYVAAAQLWWHPPKINLIQRA